MFIVKMLLPTVQLSHDTEGNELRLKKACSKQMLSRVRNTPLRRNNRSEG